MTKRRRSDSGRTRLGHDRGRGCSHAVITHRYTTPMHKHLWGDDSLLSPPLFALGFPGAWESVFSFLGLMCSHPAWGLGPTLLCKIQLDLLNFPWLSPKIASPAKTLCVRVGFPPQQTPVAGAPVPQAGSASWGEPRGQSCWETEAEERAYGV